MNKLTYTKEKREQSTSLTLFEALGMAYHLKRVNAHAKRRELSTSVLGDCCLIPQLSNNKNQKWTFCLMSLYVISAHRQSVFRVQHYLYMTPLTSVLAEQIGVSTSISHQQHKFPVILIPDEKPVWSDVALPVALVLSVKDVRPILLWEFAFC